MKPDFALNLSHDGLSLLHRQPDGWGLLGEVAVDDPALTKKLGELRQMAEDLAGPDFTSKLVIPNSQILYREISETELGKPASRRAILAALDGATPYSIDELAFDWVTAENGTHHVAVIASETLEEAENFAAEHNFDPISFVAIPDPDTYPGEPFFGPSSRSERLLDSGQKVDPDETAITVVELTKAPEPTVEAEAKVPPAPPPGETAPETAEIELPEPDLSEPDEPLVLDGTFSTSRTTDSGPDLIVPDPNRPSARFMLYADKFEPAIEPLPDLGLGGTENSPPEILKGSITASSLPGEKRSKPKRKKPEPKRQNPPMVAAMSRKEPLPPEVSEWAAQQTTEPRRSQALDGENLTVFGARRTAQERQKSAPIALLISLGAVVFAALIFLAWAFFPTLTGEPEFTQTEPVPSPVTQTSTLTAALDPAQPSATQNGILVPTTQGNLAPETPETAQLPAPGDQITDSLPSTHETAPLPAAEPDDQLASLDDDTTALEPVIDPTRPILDGDLTLETAGAIHTETGIWPLSPAPPVDLDVDRTDGIYIASIDRQIISNDAVALPSGLGVVADIPLREMLPPPPAGTTFELDERGFVVARPQGSLTPQGIMVFLGRPAYTPLLRPGTVAVEVPEDTPTQTAPGTRPRARPGNLIEIDEKARLGGRTRTQLAGIRPLARPESAQDIQTPENTEPTEFAVLASVPPTTRPNGFSSIVERAVAEALASAPATSESAGETSIAAPSSPSIPTRASVARAATTENAINLSQVNLIGIYGSSSDRRALVRLKSGRFVKVQIGDRLDGGKVAAISTNKLQYTKSGRILTLEIAS